LLGGAEVEGGAGQLMGFGVVLMMSLIRSLRQPFV